MFIALFYILFCFNLFKYKFRSKGMYHMRSFVKGAIRSTFPPHQIWLVFNWGVDRDNKCIISLAGDA